MVDADGFEGQLVGETFPGPMLLDKHLCHLFLLHFAQALWVLGSGC